VNWCGNRRCCPHRRFPHQFTLLARCAEEAATLCVTAARTPDAVRVLLSASEGLPGLAAGLGGRHIRITHDVITTADRPVRMLDRATRRWQHQVAVLCPTSAVRDAVAREHPQVPAVIRPFALAEPGDRLDHAERATARRRFGIEPGATAITLVGGWWPHKDVATIDTALHRLGRRAHVVVAGMPLDDTVLATWRTLLGSRLLVHHRALSEAELRTIYAATDLLLVARKPGVATESGLVFDAAATASL